MKKVLLVNTNTEQAPYPVPPLGLCQLASSLEGRYQVRIWDSVVKRAEGLAELVSEWQPDYIGFSIRNIDDILVDRVIFYIDEIIRDFIEPVKKVTQAPIILGGSGFSIFPAELMKMTGADYGITGEGETALEGLLDRLDHGEKPQAVTAADKHSHIFLSSYSHIDKHLDFDPYRTKSVYSIQTKRGCSHGCIYCTYPLIEGRSYRIRPPEEIADEVEQVYRRLGTITVEFVDSTFNDPFGHAEEICRAIIRRKVKMRFRTMGINPRHTSPELFHLMKEAGFTQIDSTPDSASPRVLKRMKKGFGLEDIIRTAEMIREAELPTMWFFLFGGPGETGKTVGETFHFIDRHVHPDDMVFMSGGLRIYPGTPLHRIALREGIVRKDQSLLTPAPFYFSPDTPREELDKLLREAGRTRPNCIIGSESTPSQEMMAEAIQYRRSTGTQEPMFRTLLRIRKRLLALGES